MKRRSTPTGRHAEDNTVSVAPGCCRTVEIAVAGLDQPGYGLRASRAVQLVAEVEEHGHGAAGSHLEDGPTTALPVEVGGAVEVPVVRLNQRTGRTGASGRGIEIVQDGKRAAGCDVEGG